jgi:hypothetical protein
MSAGSLTTMKDPIELKSYSELITYLYGCLAEDGKRYRPDIAASIVGLGGNRHFEDWYRTDRCFPEFWQLYEIAADMEIPEVYGLHEEDWQKLKGFTDLFAKKLEIWPRLDTAQGLIDYLDACVDHKSIQDSIQLSILSLKEHEHIKSLLKDRKYPDLNELIEVAGLLEEEWDAPYSLKTERRNRMSVLIWQLQHTYKA